VLIAVGLLFSLVATITFARPSNDPPLIDDFESGLPGTWFQYGDYGSGTFIHTTVVSTNTVPGLNPNHVLQIGYNSAGWGAGTGNNLGGQDWSGYDGFSFWFKGAATGATFRLILSDNPDPNLPGDTAERFAYEFVDHSAGWRHILIPWGAFFRDYAYQPPGAPNDGLTLTNVQAYALALPSGTSATVYLDDVRVVKFQRVDDFESGLPGTWFQYGDYGSGTFINTTVVPTHTVPGLNPNHVLQIGYNSAGWGAGTGNSLGGQDWSDFNGMGFWFWGSNSGQTYRLILSDNPDPNLPGDTAERFAYEFADNFNGWRFISIPWGAFFRDYVWQPPGAPNDGLTLTNVQAYALALPGGQRTTYLDNVSLFGDGEVTVRVDFMRSSYTVEEGQTVTLTVALNTPAAAPVTVDVATTGGTATPGGDYQTISTTLTFPPGVTEQLVVLQTVDDDEQEGDETVIVTLSNPVGAGLGAHSQTTVTIVDNDAPILAGKSVLIDDFEQTGLPRGVDRNGIGVGYVTWNHPAASAAITLTTAPPAPVPGAADPNTVLQLDLTIGPGQWAGYTHAFTNETADTWLSRNWSSYVGVSFWLYGNNTGGTLFFDILENRNPGSTRDDAERWSVDIPDTFQGWRFFQVPFADFRRKEIGNGAPNDGLTLTEVWGYAVGGYGSVDMGSHAYFVDDVGLLVRTTVIDDFEQTGLPRGVDRNGIGVGYVTWNHPAASAAITLTTAPPAPVPGAADPNTVLQLDLTIGPGQWAGYTHAFTNETADTWLSRDWSTYEGICFWLYGNNTGGTLFFDILENRNPGSTRDDAERWSVDIPDTFQGWRFFQVPFADFRRKEIGNGAPNDGLTLTEVWGYAVGGYGSVDMGSHAYFVDDVTIYGNVGGGPTAPEIAFARTSYRVNEGDTVVVTVTLSAPVSDTVTVAYRSAESYARPHRDFVPVSGTLTFAAGQTEAAFTVETFDNGKHDGNRALMLNLSHAVGADLGFARRAMVTIVDDDPVDTGLLDDFEGWHPFQITGVVTLTATELTTTAPEARPGQEAYEGVVRGEFDTTTGSAGFFRTFARPQDWTRHHGIGFWYYGSGSGKPVRVELRSARSAAAGASQPSWVLVWSDEFNDPAGTPPNPNHWTHEIGDGTMNGIPGWGNGEFQFYTDDPANASTDGQGNLVISLRSTENDPSRICWYGTCRYTSARLISARKVEFQYGRIEARIQVPAGPAGLWPAFWMLGADIDEVGWPQSGEIDIMEYVSRFPNSVYGTIHGPGYSGGTAFGNTYTLSEPVSANYHTFAVEWEPGEMRWYVDDIHYHTARPVDVAPNPWVFEHPFYLILNMAIGGNFGGAIDPAMTFPQELKIDYVRVYAAPRAEEHFEASFVDDTVGWKKVVIPFAHFARRPELLGASADGLDLSAVTGYGLHLPENTRGSFLLDEVRLYYVYYLLMYNRSPRQIP
jgi:beta-glucanase (GH16 family)